MIGYLRKLFSNVAKFRQQQWTQKKAKHSAQKSQKAEKSKNFVGMNGGRSYRMGNKPS